AGCARVAPDPAVIVQLVKPILRGCDGNGLGVVVEPLPAWAGVAVAGSPRRSPDPAAVMQLVQMFSCASDLDGLGIVVELLPARAGVPSAGCACVTPDGEAAARAHPIYDDSIGERGSNHLSRSDSRRVEFGEVDRIVIHPELAQGESIKGGH